MVCEWGLTLCNSAKNAARSIREGAHMTVVRPRSAEIHTMPFGAELSDCGTRFQLWAPKCDTVFLALRGEPPQRMERDAAGWHRLLRQDVGAGALYQFRLPDGAMIADPASRFQPLGIEDYSEVIDPTNWTWRCNDWQGRPWEETVLYELHPGSFTPEGTWIAAIRRLERLAALGVTAVQIMPVAQCYGDFNWGYDGALWFAPSRAYGRPEDMKAFIDAAHGLGLMVFLDVVYNHFGAVGNPLPCLAPIFTDRHESPWGEAINLDAPGSDVVRSFIIENALYWLTEFRLDGLRLDAVHTMNDDSNTHLLEVLAARARAAHPFRHIHLTIENSDNQERWLRRDARQSPVHYTAQWNDDLHHVLHAATTGEVTGYYADFHNDTPDFEKLGRALAEGFAFQGELKPHEGQRRGQASAGLPPTAFVSYMQNHDQVGNRVHGDRIHGLAPPQAVAAFASVYLLAPQIPMIFMGEEFCAMTPFPFFSDMPASLRLDTFEGRKEELKKTPEHDDPDKPDVEDTPDPCDPKTFHAAHLNWTDAETPEGLQRQDFYRDLLATRRREIVPRLFGIGGFGTEYERLGKNAVLVCWRMGDGSRLRLYLNLSDKMQLGLPPVRGRKIWLTGQCDEDTLAPWSVLWTLSDGE